MTKPAIVILTAGAEAVAQKVRVASGGQIHALRGRASGDVLFNDTGAHLRELFGRGETIIAVMAAGAVIRLLAPVLGDKRKEPPVVALAEDGSAAVPLLGGHRGANQIARFLEEKIGASAAVTTAGDLRFGVALDEPPTGWVLQDTASAKAAMAALLGGQKAVIEDGQVTLDWLRDTLLPLADDGTVRIVASNRSAAVGDLVYRPANLVLGIGCERGAGAAEVIALAEQALKGAGLSPLSIAAIASIDVKADETALHAAAEHFDVPVRFFPADVLEKLTPRLANPSDIVFREVGCHGVAEAAALALGGERARLIVEKTKSTRATAAIAEAPEPLGSEAAGRARGRLFVVGIGPGRDDWRSPEVTRMVGEATDLVGYSLYLDLLGGLADDKTRHDFDLGREEDRVRHAMELAGQGRDVALVCSGDAGIYAMATLVFELLDHGGLSDAARRIEIAVSPGISALQAAAARAGAPLGHDFCTISLSDLLTPWPAIQRRLKAAAEGDFVIAFYNPVSRRRRTQLAYAKDVLLQHRPADTPVILATNLGREGETVRIVPLSGLEVDDVDMLTTVVVGSSQSKTVETGDGKTWVYTPRGYAAKEGTQIGEAS